MKMRLADVRLGSVEEIEAVKRAMDQSLVIGVILGMGVAALIGIMAHYL